MKPIVNDGMNELSAFPAGLNAIGLLQVIVVSYNLRELLLRLNGRFTLPIHYV